MAELYLSPDNLSKSERWTTIGVEAGKSENRPCWYAIQTRGRHEKKVATQLSEKEIQTFVPLMSRLKQWSDRRKCIEEPLFPNYAFVRVVLSPEVRLSLLQTYGVVNLVGRAGVPEAIPDKEIENFQLLHCGAVPLEEDHFPQTGERVRVTDGSLAGLEGLLVARKSDSYLIISIELIERSVAIQLEGYQVEPVRNAPRI